MTMKILQKEVYRSDNTPQVDWIFGLDHWKKMMYAFSLKIA